MASAVVVSSELVTDTETVEVKAALLAAARVLAAWLALRDELRVAVASEAPSAASVVVAWEKLRRRSEHRRPCL